MGSSSIPTFLLLTVIISSFMVHFTIPFPPYNKSSDTKNKNKRNQNFYLYKYWCDLLIDLVIVTYTKSKNRINIIKFRFSNTK